MRPVLIILFISLFLLSTSTAFADEVRETKEVTPKTTVSTISIPGDPYDRAKALYNPGANIGNGGGAYFHFNTLFTPSNPEPTSLRPGLNLNNQAYPPYKLQGYCMTRDSTGLRATKFGRKLMNNQTTDMKMIFAGGNRIYQVGNINQSPNEQLIENNYLECDGQGARYFLNSVYMNGTIMGPRMEQLLKETSARRTGVENIRGTRTMVFGMR